MDALKFAGFSFLILLVFSNTSASTGDDVSKALAWFTGCPEPQIPKDVAATCSGLLERDENIFYHIPFVSICKFLLETHKDCLRKLQNLNCTTNGKNNSLTVANLLGHPDLRMCETFANKFEDAELDLTIRCIYDDLPAAAKNGNKCLEKELSHQSKNISICALGADNYLKCTQVWNSEKCFKQNKKMKTLFSSIDGIMKETFNLFCIPNYGKDDKAKQCNKPDDVITKINQCLAGFLDEFPYDTKDSCKWRYRAREVYKGLTFPVEALKSVKKGVDYMISFLEVDMKEK